MIRLLQRFEGFTLAEDKQVPPPWKVDPPLADSSKRGMFGPGWPGTKRKAVEKIWPSGNIVLSVKVCYMLAWSHLPVFRILSSFVGRIVGSGQED